MPSLLHAVLADRDKGGIEAITAGLGADATLEDVIEAGLAFYADDAGARSFDALEAEAVDPSHPAHQYFVDRDDRVFMAIRPIVEREFQDPDRLLRLLRAVIDGLRLRRMRDPDNFDWRTEWSAVRDAVYAASPLHTPGTM
jgi:hypothetical protein